MLAQPDVPATEAWPSNGRAWYTLAVLLLAYTLSYADRMVMNLLIEPIKHSFDISDTQVSLLIGFAFGMFYVLMGLPFGFIADRVRRTNLIAVGIVSWSTMTALCGAAGSFGLLLIGRMGVGVGEATLAPSAYSLLSDTFPRHRLARAASIYAIGVPLGMGTALMLGGYLGKALMASPFVSLPLVGQVESWRTVLLVLALLGVPMALLALTLREPLRREHDTGGAPVRFSDTLRFMKKRRSVLIIYLAGASIFAGAFNGMISWVPSFLIRTYKVSITEAGYAYGLIFATFGLAGLLLGGFVADYLTKRGYADGPLRATWIASILALPTMVAFTLAPNFTIAIALLCPATMVVMMTPGVTLTVMQLMTPSRFRGQMTSLFLLFSTIFGVGTGPTLVALITDHVFQDPMKLHYAMMIVFLIELPLAIILYGAALRPYREALLDYDAEQAEAEARRGT